MAEKIAINPGGDLKIEISETPSPNPVSTGGALPINYPATDAELRKLFLQAVVYPHLFIVRPMRFSWSYTPYDTKAWTEADFLGGVANGGAASGNTGGVTWRHTNLVADSYTWAIWIGGDYTVHALVEDLYTVGWEDHRPLSDFYEGPTDLTVHGVDGVYYNAIGDYIIHDIPNLKTARALIDPGTAGLPP